ncbi:MAG: hypothetical protein K2Y22_14250 [Candidatus Obscuribacterales bacterium]|nr:hypothetical protein [Candidatus Obscuribacterales bacterium]
MDNRDYAQRVRDRLTDIFDKRATFQTQYHFGATAAELDKTSVLLLLLLTQRVNYLTCENIERVRGIYDLHDYVPYEKLRTEAGKQTIEDLLAEHTTQLDGILLQLDARGDVLFTAVHPTQRSRVIKARDVLIGMDDTLAQYIRKGGQAEALTPKCHIYGG